MMNKKIDNILANTTIMPCPFCGRMPEFAIDDAYTKNQGTILGCGLRFGCSDCVVYPKKPGHIYELEIMLDPNRESGIRYMKDERMDLIHLWNTRVNKKREDQNETNPGPLIFRAEFHGDKPVIFEPKTDVYNSDEEE